MTGFAVTTGVAAATDVVTPLLALLCFEERGDQAGVLAAVDLRMGGEIGRRIERRDFEAKLDETLLLFPRSGELEAQRLVLIGLGSRADFRLERLRRAAGLAVRQAERVGAESLALTLDGALATEGVSEGSATQALAEAAVMAAWDFRELKSSPAPQDGRPRPADLLLLVPSELAEECRRGAEFGSVAGAAANLARELAIKPGNVATPTYLAGVAEDIAAECGLACTVMDRSAMLAEGLRAVLAVAAGSDEEPRFIILEYHGGSDTSTPPLVLVGKGITFDSGGISIKPSDKMEQMKYDMSGAAAVLGAMRGIALRRIRTNVVALIPATENLPSGRALKPGDVIRAHSGKSIEIINTDAEGRLILADALSFALKYRPRAILDAATLTGSCVIALGHHAVALMGNDESLLDEVRAAGDRAGERCWPLPLWDEYRSQLDSQVADIQNMGGRAAGTITAGWFLREFVGNTPWAHLDIAGTAWLDDPPPYLRKGPSGMPTRLLLEWVRTRAEA